MSEQNKKLPVVGMVEMGNDPFRRYMKNKYLKALTDSGAVPMMLPDTCEEAALRQAFEGCDGLLLPGGADINPALYGERPHAKCGKPNETRDIAEPFLLKLAMESGRPVLGICRGCQMINVALGGSLWQDIGEMEGKHPGHMAFLRRARHVHTVTLEKGGLLPHTGGRDIQGVNTMHHQALHRIAPCLVTAAVSEDGIAEAVQLEDGRFVLGVQWHPEHLFQKDCFSQDIFRAFITACCRRGG